MKDYVLAHSSSRPTHELLDTWLNQGGVATPVAERIRKGVGIHGGMSPEADLNNGTSDYLFTRIRKRSNAGAQWLFKPGSLPRMDALSMGSDWLGGHHKIDAPGVRQAAAKTVPEFKKNAGRGSNETLFKHGFNLLDELDTIKARTLTEKDRSLQIFKRHKIPHLNNGRAVEDIVTIK